jgi:P27 family predicted phage terminase small subunit
MAPKSKITALPLQTAQTNAIKPPGHLKTAGKRLWREVSGAFELEEHDHVVLDALCEAVDRKNQAEKDLRNHGSLTFENRYGELKPHPAVAIARDCAVLIARLRRELCLSEVSEGSRPPPLRFGGPK